MFREPVGNLKYKFIVPGSVYNNCLWDWDSWLTPYFDRLETFIGYYIKNCRHESGLYYWFNDSAIGVDNDPCTFYRSDNSYASVFLNCMMYKELDAVKELAAGLGYDDKIENIL